MSEEQVTLLDRVRSVARLREDSAMLRAALVERQKAFDLDNADLIERMIGVRDTLSAYEATLKSEIVAAYKAQPEDSKSKKVAPGCGIQEKTVVEYDGEKALAWAQEHHLCLIPESLDGKEFEKIVKATPAVFEFAEIKVIPSATLATDLNAALKEAAGAAK